MNEARRAYIGMLFSTLGLIPMLYATIHAEEMDLKTQWIWIGCGAGLTLFCLFLAYFEKNTCDLQPHLCGAFLYPEGGAPAGKNVGAYFNRNHEETKDSFKNCIE